MTLTQIEMSNVNGEWKNKLQCCNLANKGRLPSFVTPRFQIRDAGRPSRTAPSWYKFGLGEVAGRRLLGRRRMHGRRRAAVELGFVTGSRVSSLYPLFILVLKGSSSMSALDVYRTPRASA